MLTQYNSISDLMDAIYEDRRIEGQDASTANRFPVRFVLFDNFVDCVEFIRDLQNSGTTLLPQRIDNWMDGDYPDLLITHSKLAAHIQQLIKMHPSTSLLITPLSELARFYNNEDPNHEFTALIKTIKAIETTEEGFVNKQRVYIPIIGQEGKMEAFKNDSQSFIYYFNNNDRELNYKLILTNNSLFGVQNLDAEGSKFSIAHTAKEWLTMWKYPELRENIICLSPNIYANAHHAKPDNAFNFCPCDTARKFLVEGLDLDLGFIEEKAGDEPYWEMLASEIDYKNFSFDKFFNKRFSIYDLSDYKVFFQTWFNNHDAYSRWLLAAYYTKRFCNEGYICRVLSKIEDYSDASFVSELAIHIFSMENPESAIEERREGLLMAEQKGVQLPPETQAYVAVQLKKIAEQEGYHTALRYITTLTKAEKHLIIDWLSAKHIERADIQTIYPDLYYYMGRTLGNAEPWILDYMDAYKEAKIANVYTERIKSLINQYNQNELTFNSWYQKLPTVLTNLHDRSDIDVYFWIDGLGMDWTPFIAHLIEERNFDGYYLNEVYAARAVLPTKTDINKEQLLKLAGNVLDKKGDIDQLAHTYRDYPQYIEDDLEVVKKAINDILDNNPGCKIAIISDHGITYMSQLCQGLNLQGYTSDHGGRVAVKKGSGIIVEDEHYFRLGDHKTICALKHESLMAKIGDGAGSHGGCTPEEVVVPILIISPEKEARNWRAMQITRELEEGTPYFEAEITSISSPIVPIIEYDGVEYKMERVENAIFRSERMKLNPDVTKVILRVGLQTQEFNVTIKMAAAMDDDLLSF